MAMRLLTLGTSHADAGAPVGNTLYGMDSTGGLRWYKYSGAGESCPAPGLDGWNHNSGNPICNGLDFRWMQLGTAGVMTAIHGDGSLYWWRYEGDGMGSSSARGAGWGYPSGRNMADNWGDYQHVMLFYNDGDEVILLTVDDQGTMLPHAYTLDVGWDADFTTPVPGDWSGFTQLIATTSTIFGVKSDGNLYWYQPQWTGNSPVWTMAPNSGNQIGTGWDSLRLLAVGGLDDPERGLHPTLVGIDPEGQLRWFSYTGSGSGSDEDWGPNSGNFINGSW